MDRNVVEVGMNVGVGARCIRGGPMGFVPPMKSAEQKLADQGIVTVLAAEANPVMLNY